VPVDYTIQGWICGDSRHGRFKTRNRIACAR